MHREIYPRMIASTAAAIASNLRSWWRDPISDSPTGPLPAA